MSAEDRVHEPSPVRMIQAQNQGQVARSAELSRSILFCITTGSLLIFAANATSLFAFGFEWSVENAQLSLSGVNGIDWRATILKGLAPLILFLVAVLGVGLVVWHLQSPILVHPQKATPDLTRCSPWPAFQKMFQFDNWIRVGLGGLLLMVLICIAVLLVWTQRIELVQLMTQDIGNGMQSAAVFLNGFALAAGATLMAYGSLDFVRERFRVAAALRMTDEERREEARRSSGP